MHTLAGSYAVLGEEQRLSVIEDLYTFSRNQGELTEQLLTRFDAVRLRAAQQGQVHMSFEGLTFILVRALGCTDQQLITLLQPLNGQMPTTVGQYHDFIMRLRRMSHIIERTPMNIGQSLRGRQDRQYLALTDGPQQMVFGSQGSEATQWNAYPTWPA